MWSIRFIFTFYPSISTFPQWRIHTKDLSYSKSLRIHRPTDLASQYKVWRRARQRGRPADTCGIRHAQKDPLAREIVARFLLVVFIHTANISTLGLFIYTRMTQNENKNYEKRSCAQVEEVTIIPMSQTAHLIPKSDVPQNILPFRHKSIFHLPSTHLNLLHGNRFPFFFLAVAPLTSGTFIFTMFLVGIGVYLQYGT